MKRLAVLLLGAALTCTGADAQRLAYREISGICPHLATFNDESECGTGAVVPWADRLWVISYGPHLPFGSSDKLYEITPDLQKIIRPESVGGTPANRMIHRESRQLLIGPYLIDEQPHVRVIPPARMPGRLTGNARHLTDPTNKVYYATMEEGLYEVDVHTLEVFGKIKDANAAKPGQTDQAHPASIDSQLPGYHGKGLYSGQGRVVYANNGEQSARALIDPTIPSGALAEWRGSGDWQMVRRNQFTEVTGPGGIEGNDRPSTDPIWSIGWDARSLILMLLDHGKWRAYRLPKASHCYDGAHGWNTEWPRIRDIGPDGKPDYLMTMHGMFWRFPKTFSIENSAGIAPRSTYLKVIGDFCRWNDRVVFGCDDTAKSEFLNRHKAKGKIAAPGQSQSNLWFVDPNAIDDLGPALGRGALWLEDAVQANVPSDPFMLGGFRHRGLHLTHDSPAPLIFTMEVDVQGNDSWHEARRIEVPARGYAFVDLTEMQGTWVRLRVARPCDRVSAVFQYRNEDRRSSRADSAFDGLAGPSDTDVSGGLLFARGANLRTLRCAARRPGQELGAYDMSADLALRHTNDPAGLAWVNKNLAVPRNVLTSDNASVLFIDERGTRWRLPKGDAALDGAGALGDDRIDREVCTERDLFNCHGTFYELPAENAGGFAKIRPIATHNRRINDYCSYRGLLVISGVRAGAEGSHILRSDDGKCRLWVGAVDDLWRLGKPRGTGGPWKQTAVNAGVPSDPYLVTGFDVKRIAMHHSAPAAVTFHIEVDFAGTGKWARYRDFEVEPGKAVEWKFPDAFGAYWLRVVADRNTTATAQLTYE